MKGVAAESVRSGPGGMITEPTVTTYVFRRDEHGRVLRIGLMWHPRFGEWFPPGGHVEAETIDQAARRETLEELGCRVRLLAAPTLPVPEGFPHRRVPGPWWIIEMAAGPDNHTRAPHRHRDHVFVAVFDGQVQPSETRVRWVSEQELADLEDVVEDGRLLAKALFPVVEELTAEAAVEGDGQGDAV